MRKLKQRYFPFLLGLLFPFLLIAQQNEFNWRIGAYGGVMTYYGDLSYRFVDPNPKLNNLFFENLDYASYGLSLERRLSNAFSFGVMWTDGQFIATDRSVDWDGEFQFQNPDFGRALNARTELWDASAFLTYYLDNGDLLGRRAVVAPYLKAGAGLTHFNVYGNLFTGPGQAQRYYYWEDGAVRDQPPGTPGAKVIEQDGIYETKLTGLQTEGKDYPNDVLSLSGGLGLKFRLGRFNINLESLIRWVDTDYLDDVSGDPFPKEFSSELQQYASNPAGVSRERRGENDNNDLYTFTSLSLHFNFGRKENEFAAPAIVTGPLLAPAIPPAPEPEPEEIAAAEVAEVSTDTLPVSAADSLQHLVDSLQKQLSQLRSERIQTDREAADSLRILADSLRMRADSLERRAGLLYAVSPDTSTAKPAEPDTTEEVSAPFPSTMHDTLTVTDSTIVKKETEAEMKSDTTRKAADTMRDSTTLQKMPATSDTVSIKRTEETPPGETTRDTLAAHSRDTALLQQPPDTALTREVARLRNQIEALSTEIEERPQPDSALQEQVSTLEGEVQQMRIDIRELRSALAARPTADPDSLPMQERLDFYQEELNALQQRIAGMEGEPQVEGRRLVTRYQTTLEEMEQIDPAVDRQRYEALQQEIDDLRRRLNITTGVGAAAGAAALATRPQAVPEQADSLAVRLQSRIESLERTVSQLQTDPFIIDPEAAADTSLLQRIDLLNERLDDLRRRQQVDPTTDLLRANIRQQRDTLRRQQEILQQQQENAADLRRRITGLESQLEELRAMIKETPLADPDERRRRMVFFDVGSFSLSVSARRTIEEIAHRAKENPGLHIRLDGYTDSSGSVQVNRQLSNRRALAVKDYLLRLGVASNRITTLPKGVDADAASPAYGRRVEIILEEG